MKRLHIFLISFAVLLTLAKSASDPTDSGCQVNSDCSTFYNCIEGTCVHKELFPLSAREIIGTFIILLMSSLLTAGGVGGGASYVPYIMLLFEIDLQKAIAYAYACAFGGGVGNIANAIFLKNPKTKRYMINFDVNMIILPALMAGVLVGGILQRIFPPLVINIILLLVLTYSLYKNGYKLKLILRKEKQERIRHEPKIEIQQQQSPEILTTEAPLQTEEEKLETELFPAMIEYDENQEAEAEENNNSDEEKAQVKPKHKTQNEDEQPQTADTSPVLAVEYTTPQDLLTQRRLEIEKKELKFPFHKLALLTLNVVIVIFVGVIRGTKKFDPIVGVDWSCGWDFIWFAIALILFGGASLLSIYFVNKWQKEKISVGYEFLPEEPILNRKSIIKLTISSIIGGTLGSLVALGGGMLVAPTLLDMGMPPAFCAAATGLLLVFSQFNTMFQNIMNKRISALEVAWFVPLAIMCSYASSKIVNYYVRKTGRQSIILIMLISITIAGFGCIIYNLINGLVVDSTKETTFTNVC